MDVSVPNPHITCPVLPSRESHVLTLALLEEGLEPVINEKEEKNPEPYNRLFSAKRKKMITGGDGRCDSPGYLAKHSVHIRLQDGEGSSSGTRCPSDPLPLP